MHFHHSYCICDSEWRYVSQRLYSIYTQDFFKLYSSYCFSSHFDNNSIFFIFDPIHIENQYFSVHSIWKKYLAANSYNAKIVILGFMNQHHPNYLDLLSFSGNLKEIINDALYVHENWEIKSESEDIHNTLLQFFRGHGNKSLLSQLYKIHQSLNISYISLAEGSNSFSEIWNTLIKPYFIPEFNELKIRWNNYYPLFKYLPFFSTMQILNENIYDLDYFFNSNNIDCNHFINRKFDENIQYIINQLLNIDKSYIRPEKYHEN